MSRPIYLIIKGYIEESVGRIEMATASTKDQGQGQTSSHVTKDEGHTLGGESTDTSHEPSAQPSAEEMRERRLAFFKKSSDTNQTNSEGNSINSNVNHSCDANKVNSESALGGVKSNSHADKAPSEYLYTVKPVLSGTQKEDQQLLFKTDYPLMQFKSIAECSLGAFCNTFDLHKATICL